MILRFTLFALLLAVSAQAQDFKFYWHDQWNSQEPSLIFRYDKLSHGVRDGAIFYCLGKTITKDAKPRFIATTSFAVAYEIWDGFRWRKTGGFSFHDIAAGLAGQGIIFFGEKLFDKPKRQQAYDEQVQKEIEGLAVNPVLSAGDVIASGEKFFCPQCKTQGQTSRVYIGSAISTLAYSQPFYDESGKWHNHDPNIVKYSYSCSNGHKWESKESSKCWCGWLNQ